MCITFLQTTINVFMKKLLIILTAGLFLAGCVQETPQLKKPFVIIEKTLLMNENTAGYIFQDADGNNVSFSDSTNAFKVGDIIE